MKVKYVNISTTTSLNTANIMSVAPIRESEDGLVLWRPFIDDLSQSVLDYLTTLKYRVVDDFPIPNVSQMPISDEMNRLLMLYIDSFDYQHHHDEYTMGLAKIILIPEKYKEEMAEITNIRLQNDRPINKFLDRDALEYLLPLIRVAMTSHSTWFVKLSTQSNKHDSPIRSVETAEGILDVITSSPTLLRNEWLRRNKPTYIILKPWNSLINKYNEFRLFVRASKITAATQQQWSVQLDHSQEYIQTVRNVIDNYKHSDKLPQNCVLDVVILENSRMIIIELNPWICSGSALFEWTEDYQILYGLQEDPQLRLATT